MADTDNLLSFSLDSAVNAEITVPGDKSISHRSVIFSSLATGISTISGFLQSDDCLATLNIMRQLGVSIEQKNNQLIVKGVGLHGLKAPVSDLDCGNAGTAMRLLTGLMAVQKFESSLVGDESLSSRPMNRVIKPLQMMGCEIESDNGRAPLRFKPVDHIKNIDYQSPIASAQVKSCVLIAGMYANGKTSVTEPVKSRDHTENMLKGFGCELKVDGLKVEITAQPQLTAQDITVPADISSAAFFLVLGLCKPNSKISIKNLCLNPSRDGVIKILRHMGGNITVENKRLEAGESLADVTVQSSKLKGIEIPVDLIPSAIDEFPILFVAAALSSGTTTLRQATELRHKESDRIAVMINGLKTLGIDCEELTDGVIIHGGELQSGYVDAHGDHRCAMSFLIAGALSADKKITVAGTENIKTSFPGFLSLAQKIGIKAHQIVPVISIDGPSGVGKGTISALVAERLGFHLLDSGSIYRALAYKVLKDNIELDDIDALVKAAQNLDLKFESQANQLTQVYLDGQLINEELRTEKCGDTASMIAPIKAVRAALLQRQREFCQAPGLVADGRDMGTVVFKNSCLKVFLTASAKKRAQRRFKQLINKGVDVNIHDLFRDIEKRDARDSSREVAPLVPAKDAIKIDTSDMSIEQVLNKVMYHVKHRLKLN